MTTWLVLGGAAVVKVALKFATMLSGGLFVSSSVTPLAATLIAQVVLDGRSLAGSMTTLERLLTTVLLATRVPAGHSTVIAPAATSTASLKLTVILVFTATFVAPFAGVVLDTEGAASA